jgi:ankyrin repeat protein
VKPLLEKGVDVESKDGVGQTLLLLAARNEHEAVVKLLLKKGADVKSKDGVSRTPLSRAAICGHGHGHEAAMKLLLEKGATVIDQHQDMLYGIWLVLNK